MNERQSSVPNYPDHTHQFVVIFYENDHIDYIFGPFVTRHEADNWARDFNTRYARPGERYRYSRRGIYPVCAALTPASA